VKKQRSVATSHIASLMLDCIKLIAFLKRQNLTFSAVLTVYLLNKPTSFSLRIGNSNASDAHHQAFHSAGMLKRGKMSA
jgi:hypothetical protein